MLIKKNKKMKKKKVYAVCRRFDEKAAPHLSFAFVTLVLHVNIISCFIANLKFLFIDLRHSYWVMAKKVLYCKYLVIELVDLDQVIFSLRLLL